MTGRLSNERPTNAAIEVRVRCVNHHPTAGGSSRARLQRVSGTEIEEPSTRLARRLGLFDATTLGVGAMLGSGVFVAFAPAAAAAGRAVLVGVLVASLVAYANANSSAQRAARYPRSGGAYVYGRELLGRASGFLAGWVFVVGRVASCAAGALTFGTYVVPDHPRLAACTAALVLTAVNYRGIERTATATRVLAGVVLAVLALAVAAAWNGAPSGTSALLPETGTMSLDGVLGSAAIMFFAFAGSARIATLGEEVRDPVRTIPRAILAALAAVVTTYLVVGATLLATLGVDELAASPAPVLDAATGDPSSLIGIIIRLGAGVAGLGVVLALLAGVSRTILAMARDGELPRFIAAVHPLHGVPHRAELLVGAVVAATVAVAELDDAIAVSACTVLVYYAIANASAMAPRAHMARWTRAGASFGLVGCLVLASRLPTLAVCLGIASVLAGLAIHAIRCRITV